MIDFHALEKELEEAIATDEKYQRENDAKFRAVNQKVSSYEEFRFLDFQIPLLIECRIWIKTFIYEGNFL